MGHTWVICIEIHRGIIFKIIKVKTRLYKFCSLKGKNMKHKYISIKEVAKIMGKSDQFIRVGLQRGTLSFGIA